MPLEIHQFPCLSDNYGYLLHDPASGETACIDTPDAEACLREAAGKKWQITQIWNTHWHPDHAGGNAAIQKATGCTIHGPAEVAAKFPLDVTLAGGDSVVIGATRAQVIDVGGHTAGHVAYYLPDAGIAFVGDALFALGCGRMFEGTAPQFWASLLRLRSLPADTLVYCAHEYTAANAQFALHADPENATLRAYAEEVAQRRSMGQPTVPFPLARELAANPFLRADLPEMQVRWGGTSPDETFAALRAAKDNFR